MLYMMNADRRYCSGQMPKTIFLGFAGLSKESKQAYAP